LCDLSFFAASEPPPPAAELPDDWEGDVLGTPEEIRREISECIPEVTWSRPDLGVYAGRDFRIEFDLGQDAPIRKLTVRARGGGQVLRPLARLVRRWRWYPYLESEREWVHHCDEATLLSLKPRSFPEEPA